MNRVPCDVAGCPRTMGREVYERRFGHEPGAWICSGHWRRLTKVERRVHARLHRLAKRYGPEAAEGREWRIWPRLVARAASRPPAEPARL